MKEVTQPEIEQALQRMLSVAEQPRALAIRPDDRATLRQAVQRTHAQLLGEADAVLTIALAGCTGSGKSTLINALAGSRIASMSDRRPCTTQTRVYHHGEVPCGGLPGDLAEQATFVAHDRPELRQKVIVDTPDLDTFYTEHRDATRALLKAAGLVIYVFSPERYVEERAWSVIREEQRFSACLAVLNKADTVPPEVLQRIAGEIRQRFAEMGKPDIPVLCISAAHHVAEGDSRPAATSQVTLDEFLTLRAYIEHELQAGDIARMIRQQRGRVLDHLQDQADRLIPADVEPKLDALADAARQRAQDASNHLADQLQDQLLAIEADLYPLIVVRKHQRFWGPFRTWLAVTDFLRYGLPRLVRQLRLLTLPAQERVSGRLLPAGKADQATDRLRQQAQQLQTLCFEKGLPVERWRTITSGIDGEEILAVVARGIEDRFEALAASAYRRGQVFPWLISFVAWLMPAGLVVFAAYNLVRQFTEGHSEGLNVLWDFLGMLVLSYLLLHIVTGAASSGRGLLPRKGVAAETLDDVLRRTLNGWVKVYRDDLEADVADLREPLAVLRGAAEGMIVRAGLPPAEQTSTGPGGKAVPVDADRPEQAGNDGPQTQPPQDDRAPDKQGADEPLSAAELLRQSMQSAKPAGKDPRGKPRKG